MDFVLAIAEDKVPSTHAPDPCYASVQRMPARQHHGLLRAAEFAADGPRQQHARLGAAHRAVGWAACGAGKETKARLQAAGIDVIGITDHTIFRSICFFDPNGPPSRAGLRHGHAGDAEEVDDVKWEMLDEWSRTKRAPKHAQWMRTKAELAGSPFLRAARRQCAGRRVFTQQRPTAARRLLVQVRPSRAHS